jgi:Tfp pilus assembly protein PilV
MKKQDTTGFSLIEVMIAVAIFFMATFSILDLTTQSIKSARALSQNSPSAGMLAAELSMTNKLEEGVAMGDFGRLYPEYTWERQIISAATNGLFRVDFVVYHKQRPDSQMSLLLFRPDSPQVGSFGQSGNTGSGGIQYR